MAKPLWSCDLAVLGHEMLQQAEIFAAAAASEVGFCPVLVLGCGSCQSAQRAPLSRKQVAVALTLLDFDRLRGESFRVLGKLPK